MMLHHVLYVTLVTNIFTSARDFDVGVVEGRILMEISIRHNVVNFGAISNPSPNKSAIIHGVEMPSSLMAVHPILLLSPAHHESSEAKLRCRHDPAASSHQSLLSRIVLHVAHQEFLDDP